MGSCLYYNEESIFNRFSHVVALNSGISCIVDELSGVVSSTDLWNNIFFHTIICCTRTIKIGSFIIVWFIPSNE